MEPADHRCDGLPLRGHRSRVRARGPHPQRLPDAARRQVPRALRLVAERGHQGWIDKLAADAAPIPGPQPGRSLTMSGSTSGVAPNRSTSTYLTGRSGERHGRGGRAGALSRRRAPRAQAGGGNYHKRRSASERSAADWNTILMHMRVRANLPAHEAGPILTFLKAH